MDSSALTARARRPPFPRCSAWSVQARAVYPCSANRLAPAGAAHGGESATSSRGRRPTPSCTVRGKSGGRPAAVRRSRCKRHCTTPSKRFGLAPYADCPAHHSDGILQRLGLARALQQTNPSWSSWDEAGWARRGSRQSRSRVWAGRYRDYCSDAATKQGWSA